MSIPKANPGCPCRAGEVAGMWHRHSGWRRIDLTFQGRGGTATLPVKPLSVNLLFLECGNAPLGVSDTAEQLEHPEGFKQNLQLLGGDHPAAARRSCSPPHWGLKGHTGESPTPPFPALAQPVAFPVEPLTFPVWQYIFFLSHNLIKP